MNYIAKSRVGVTKAGKFTDANSVESVSLFAPAGAVVPEKKLAGKEGVTLFFRKEGEPVEVAPHKRVEAEPEAPRGHKAPNVKGK